MKENPTLAIDKLTVRYGDHVAVAGFDLTLKEGERYCLVGESGSGKTSIALAASRLLPPEADVSGTIELHGTDLYSLNHQDLQALRRSKISVIFQDPVGSLLPGISIKKQLTRVVRFRMGLTSENETEEVIIDHLHRVGLSDHSRVLRSTPSQLSGGMCQRIMIAMALCVEPALVIADEPTSALDVLTQEKILDLLVFLQNEINFAMLFITHDLRIAAHYSNRIGVMQKGTLVESSDTPSFFKNQGSNYSRNLVVSAKKLSV